MSEAAMGPWEDRARHFEKVAAEMAEQAKDREVALQKQLTEANGKVSALEKQLQQAQEGQARLIVTVQTLSKVLG